MNLLKDIFYSFILAVVLFITYYLFDKVLGWYLSLSIFWMIVILIFLSRFVVSLFYFISQIVSSIRFFFDNKSIPFYLTLGYCAYESISLIYGFWSKDIDYTGKVIFNEIIATFLLISFSSSIIVAFNPNKNHEV